MGPRTVYTQNRIHEEWQPEVLRQFKPIFHREEVSLDQAGRRYGPGTSENKIKSLIEAKFGQFLHSQGVIHCDIKPDNFLLDENLDLKVCDFAGSSLYGSKALVCGSTRFWRPTLPKTPCDAQDDIFGLGSTIYMILTGKEPYGELESAEVEARYSAAEFPDTSTLPFDEAMQSCWRGRASIQEVFNSIDTSIREMQKPDGPISETAATSLHDLPGSVRFATLEPNMRRAIPQDW
jgi:serine/threonine protein kinase